MIEIVSSESGGPVTTRNPNRSDRAGDSAWENVDWRTQPFPTTGSLSLHIAGYDKIRDGIESAAKTSGFVPDELISSRSGSVPTFDLLTVAYPTRSIRAEVMIFLRTWNGAISISFAVVFLGLLLADLGGYFPLPWGFLAGPLIVAMFMVWAGFIGRPQRSEILRIRFRPLTGAETSAHRPIETWLDQSAWEVTVSLGTARWHVVLRSGFRTSRWFDGIDASSSGASNVHSVTELIRHLA